MRNVFQWIFEKLCGLSTKPDKTSYKWARRTPSALASMILWTVWFLRIFSLYQWVKSFYRWLGKAFKFGYVENASGRPDVPPMLGELYFLSFTLLFSVTHHFKIEGWFLTAAAYYFVFESSLWILYYTVFRRFFELGYKIYHQLEYILTIALLIPTQALCFARLYSMSFKETFAALLGSGGDNTPPILIIFGFFLGAIVIGMIISTFPTENIKKSVKKAKMFVIGCGDVVKSRLYPSLVDSEYTIKISAYDLENSKNVLPQCTLHRDQQAIMEELSAPLDGSSIVWVETPPDSHAAYAAHCLKKGAGMVVLEKPIASDLSDLDAIERMIALPRKRKRLFFLSYYILEKALPLTYLASLAKGDSARSKFYQKYLEISSQPLVESWQDFLGELKAVTVDISEGTDTRQWLLKKGMGGQLFETFLHHVLIATQFCGPVAEKDPQSATLKENWKILRFSDADYQKKVHEISLSAVAGKATIDLTMRKNAPEKSRTARLVFENGEIVADFDQKRAEIHFTHLKAKSVIRVKDEYAQNYSTLVDMVGRTYSNEAAPEAVDGLENQILTLRWLHTLTDK